MSSSRPEARFRLDAFDDLAAAADAAADHIAASLSEGIAARGSASFVATGGRTPGPVYRSLRDRPLDWSKVIVTLSDERWVDEDSPDSNARLVRAELLQGAASAGRLAPLKADAADPMAGEAEVERRLAALPQMLDCVMLGMGDDGHIASIFPRNARLAEALSSDHACIGVPLGPDGMAPLQPRISLTAARLNAAREVIIFVTGESKRAVIERALEDGPVEALPVRAVLRGPASVRVIWSP